MELDQIFQPVADQMVRVEQFLGSAIRESSNPSILAMGEFLLESGGKRIRPGLVILSEKAAGGSSDDVIEIATAMEMIHMASLIHDDVLDKAMLRRNKPSVNARWGDEVSIVLGDYVYSRAFEAIAQCRNPDVFACITRAIYVMCEGELTQISGRSNPDISKDRYLTIIEKKTAALFAACCQIGSILGNNTKSEMALRDFGRDVGIAFQIVDDSRDILGGQESLGKDPGQDVIAGDVTLPLMMLMEVVSQSQRDELMEMVKSRSDPESFSQIRSMFLNSDAADLTRKKALSYVDRAKSRLDVLDDSDYRRSLLCLADYVTNGISQDMLR